MKHAAYCGTRAIYGDMETSAKSLIATTDVDKVHFIIEDAEFPNPLPSIIECHDMSGQQFFLDGGANMRSMYTYMAMMRIALCYVLPDVDAVLSLDADTVFLKPADEIWRTPLAGRYFAAVPEWHRSLDGLTYCNFGVVLYNLAKLRDGKAAECIEVLNTHRFQWVEQDVGNYLCQGRIAELHPQFNSCWFTDRNAPDPVVKHYAGDASGGWRNAAPVMEYRGMDWDEVMRRHG